MPVEIRELIIRVSVGESVSGLLYTPKKIKRSAVTLILAHGAGANQSSPFMRLFATGLAERGIDVLTFNFLYMEKRKHVPDKTPILESCYSAVIDAAHRHKKLKGNRIAIGGKSMGGRIASQVAASRSAKSTHKSDKTNSTANAFIDVAALVFLGYPLHPPGRPDKLRDKHLPDITAPMLFIQGERDAFGTAEEIQKLVARLNLPATLLVIEGGDHSLKVPKKASMSQDKVYANSMDHITAWLQAR